MILSTPCVTGYLSDLLQVPKPTLLICPQLKRLLPNILTEPTTRYSSGWGLRKIPPSGDGQGLRKGWQQWPQPKNQHRKLCSNSCYAGNVIHSYYDIFNYVASLVFFKIEIKIFESVITCNYYICWISCHTGAWKGVEQEDVPARKQGWNALLSVKFVGGRPVAIFLPTRLSQIKKMTLTTPFYIFRLSFSNRTQLHSRSHRSFKKSRMMNLGLPKEFYCLANHSKLALHTYLPFCYNLLINSRELTYCVFLLQVLATVSLVICSFNCHLIL